MLPSPIHTPRLTLTLLTNPSPSSQHLQLFHENASDPDATSWNVSGTSTSMAESRERMRDMLARGDWVWGVFLTSTDCVEGMGMHVGSVSLKRNLGGATFPPLNRQGGNRDGEGDGDEGKELDVRMLGYGIFKEAWGNGYASEAVRAVLDAHKLSIEEEKRKGNVGKVWCVEAHVNEENGASMRIVEKVGFGRVG